MNTINDKKQMERWLKKSGIMNHFSICKPVFMLFHYSPGEFLTNPFSPSKYLQFVVDGKLLLYNMPDESSTVMLQSDYNEIFILGDMELLDTQFVPFFVEARTDVYTLAVYIAQYREKLLNDPVFLRHICRSLASKLNGAVMAAAKEPLRKKMVRSLQYSQIGDTVTEITHLANTLDVSKRQLLRVLKDFCEDGFLEHTGRGVYTILKKPKL